MNPTKTRNYVGLLLNIPIVAGFFLSDYRREIFTLEPKRTKFHDAIQGILESIFGDGRYYHGSSDEALYFWWLLLVLSIALICYFRSKIGSVIVNTGQALHRKV